MILMRLHDKNQGKQERNDSKSSSLVNCGTNEVWLPTEVCLLLDSAACNKIKLLNDAFSAFEAFAIARSSWASLEADKRWAPALAFLSGGTLTGLLPSTQLTRNVSELSV